MCVCEGEATSSPFSPPCVCVCEGEATSSPFSPPPPPPVCVCEGEATSSRSPPPHVCVCEGEATSSPFSPPMCVCVCVKGKLPPPRSPPNFSSHARKETGKRQHHRLYYKITVCDCLQEASLHVYLYSSYTVGHAWSSPRPCPTETWRLVTRTLQ